MSILFWKKKRNWYIRHDSIFRCVEKCLKMKRAFWSTAITVPWPFMKQNGVYSDWNQVGILKVVLWSWSSGSKQIWVRSFKLGTIRLSMSIHSSSKVIGCQSLQSNIISITWSLSAKIAMLEGGPWSIFGLGQLWRLVLCSP